jgi:hypothetical protein
MKKNLGTELIENKELAQKFKNKNIFIVNSNSFYCKLFADYFKNISKLYGLNIGLTLASRENGFDCLNIKDVDHHLYKSSDIVIYHGVDFSSYKDTDCEILTSINIVTSIANLLQKKNNNCLFYYFNSNTFDLLNCKAIYSAINLVRTFFVKKNKCYEPAIPIYNDNMEYCFIEMIKDISNKI